jgi:hypothetical protein
VDSQKSITAYPLISIKGGNLKKEERAALLQELNALGPIAEEKATGYEEYSEGHNAFIRDVPFDANASRPWKLGWLDGAKDADDFQADNNLSV